MSSKPGCFPAVLSLTDPLEGTLLEELPEHWPRGTAISVRAGANGQPWLLDVEQEEDACDRGDPALTGELLGPAAEGASVYLPPSHRALAPVACRPLPLASVITLDPAKETELEPGGFPPPPGRVGCRRRGPPGVSLSQQERASETFGRLPLGSPSDHILYDQHRRLVSVVVALAHDPSVLLSPVNERAHRRVRS